MGAASPPVLISAYPPHYLRGPAAEAVWGLLQAADHEFVPPLSARSGTTDHRLAAVSDPSGPRRYFERMRQQWILLATIDGQPAAMMSFVAHHMVPAWDAGQRCTYLSTLIVGKAFRRRGLARQMYAELLRRAASLGDRFVVTRTWSSNEAHLNLLATLGFSLATRIEGHRGPDIDTLYWVKAV